MQAAGDVVSQRQALVPCRASAIAQRAAAAPQFQAHTTNSAQFTPHASAMASSSRTLLCTAAQQPALRALQARRASARPRLRFAARAAASTGAPDEGPFQGYYGPWTITPVRACRPPPLAAARRPPCMPALFIASLSSLPPPHTAGRQSRGVCLPCGSQRRSRFVRAGHRGGAGAERRRLGGVAARPGQPAGGGGAERHGGSHGAHPHLCGTLEARPAAHAGRGRGGCRGPCVAAPGRAPPRRRRRRPGRRVARGARFRRPHRHLLQGGE